MNIDPKLVEPFWSSTVMCRESICFIDEGTETASAALLFSPQRVTSVTNASGDLQFNAGSDYIVDAAAGRVIRVAGSRMPVIAHHEYAALVDAGDGLFHRLQVAISYDHAAALWRGYTPTPAGSQLPRTTALCAQAAPLRIAVSGDSISEGYSASAFLGVRPHQLPYPSLVAAGIEQACGSVVSLHNCAVAGWTADNAVYDIERVVRSAPDLVIIGYGMNDASYAEASDFAANIVRIISDVRRVVPPAEFVLVAPMLPNPASDYPFARFGAYRDALAALCEPGVALADMTTLWSDILGRKRWYDLAGNGLNHPNDFGHRLYAQVILGLIRQVSL